MLYIGWAEEDITPKEKISLCGEFFERVTNEVESRISVTALALESEGEQAVFCSCDLVGISSDLMHEVRRKVKAEGLRPEKIIVNAVHTHNSYTVGTLPGNKDSLDATLGVLKRYLPEGCRYVPQAESSEAMDPAAALEFLSDKIALACDRAWAGRAPGGYVPAFGRAAVGMNRRVCYSDGSAKMWGDSDTATFTSLEGGNDNGVELLFTYDRMNKLTGVVANIACPSQIMEQRTVISSDYWGKVKENLRKTHGPELKLLALCSPAGDQCPRDLIRWVEPETPIADPNVIRTAPKYRRADPSMFDVRGLKLTGRRIAAEIEAVLEDTRGTAPVTDAVLMHEAKTIRLPLRRVTDAEKAAAEKALHEFLDGRTEVDYMDTAEMHVHAGTVSRHETQETRDTVDTEVHHVRLGDVAFSTDPFELFLDYANLIRARSPAAQTFLVQLCCGDLGYLPTAKAEKGGHYSAYVSSGRVGHQGGEELVRDALETLRGFFEEEA